MGFYCLACDHLIANESVHMPKICPYCGNKDRTKIIRADDEDMNPKIQQKHKEDKKYLESRREK